MDDRGISLPDSPLLPYILSLATCHGNNPLWDRTRNQIAPLSHTLGICSAHSCRKYRDRSGEWYWRPWLLFSEDLFQVAFLLKAYCHLSNRAQCCKQPPG